MNKPQPRQDRATRRSTRDLRRKLWQLHWLGFPSYGPVQPPSHQQVHDELRRGVRAGLILMVCSIAVSAALLIFTILEVQH
jgi:hypothetical protein